MESIVAEHGLQDYFLIDSAGTYAGHSGDLPDSRMRIHASRRGYNLTHRSRQITPDDFDTSDLIVVMEPANRYSLDSMGFNSSDPKVVEIAQYMHFHPHDDHVPDPYYSGSEGFELALDLLEDGCEGLLNELCKKLNIIS